MQPETQVQERIEKTVAAFIAIEDETYAGLEKAYQETEELRTTTGDDAELVRQLVYYQSKQGLQKRMMVFFIFDHLRRVGLGESTIAAALAPHVYAEGDRLRDLVRERLHIVEGKVTGQPPDYGTYRQIIARSKESQYLPLIRYMYESAPREALLTLMGANADKVAPEERRKIVWAEHVVGNTLWKQRYDFLEEDQVEAEATEQLTKMAAHNQWWARLYAATIMRQHPEFRQPDLVERLKEDPHDLVREALAEEE